MQIQGDIEKFTNTIDQSFTDKLAVIKANYEAKLDLAK